MFKVIKDCIDAINDTVGPRTPDSAQSLASTSPSSGKNSYNNNDVLIYL